MSSVYLLGHPVAHSLSPAMHNAAFAALGLPHRYEMRDVEPNRLADVVEALRRDDVLGANVTIPHKEAVLGLVDELADEARRIGAVNTIVRRASRLLGDNTDGYGFARALAAAGVEVAGKDVMVLGAGGAARACVAALGGARIVVVAARGLDRASALAAAAGKPVRAIPWADARRTAKIDVLVNATPVGLHGEDLLSSFSFTELPRAVVDLVPTRTETPLVRRARQAQDVLVVDGLSMLLHQAARSFTLWTGREAPLAVMRAALPRAA
ncbi:MAG TPA: shikimate dehydrogenase [Candidatus Limnocylindria bacterium]|jgi:shikimate dehydrogenase|nr:shikimate dehydrogenase [Candidatus Limnocylindria bacterium]